MPDTFTPNYGLTLCEIGASRDTWGTKWNVNLTTLDEVLGFAAPIGMIVDFAGPNAPSGWLICDGRTVSRTTFAALFAVIGAYWGAGDGTTTFALPNPNGRALVGPGTVTDTNGNAISLSFTQSTGNIYNQILQGHLPNYAIYTDVQGYHAHAGATTAAGSHAHTTDAQGTHSHGGTTGYVSNDHTHSGSTDVQGYHNHSVSGLWGGPPGGALLNPGSLINTGGAVGTSTDGGHAHNFSTGGISANHYHAIGADGNHAHNVYAVGDHQHGIYGDGNHQHTIYLGGSGAWFPILQPILVVTKIIYAGQDAAVRAMVAAAPTIEGAAERDELSMIREELAQLRAILAPPRRLLSAPQRGPH